MRTATRKLCNLCLILNDIPGEWREGVIYPIPKPTEWNCNLANTRPITLLETLRKAFVKVITNRLTGIIAKRNILREGNHAALPGGSTFTPLRIINAVLEDAVESDKEIWFLFQDLSKAYDRVNLHMLEKAMKRIKIPEDCSNLLINLFSSRKNRVIGHFGMTPSYDVLVGIDQGEIISPLLWTIYYDPLLVEINDNPQFGYEMSHTWLPNVSLPESKTESVIVSSQAYMDDTSWISSSKEKLESTLSIADEFYTLNNIQVNKLKSVLLTTCNTYDATSNSREVTLSFGQEQIVITPAARNESVRVLGVWISLSSRKKFHASI